jgi:hypothetical protein
MAQDSIPRHDLLNSAGQCEDDHGCIYLDDQIGWNQSSNEGPSSSFRYYLYLVVQCDQWRRIRQQQQAKAL